MKIYKVVFIYWSHTSGQYVKVQWKALSLFGLLRCIRTELDNVEPMQRHEFRSLWKGIVDEIETEKLFFPQRLTIQK